MRAALQLAQSGYKTAVISKVFPTRSHTVSAQGGITCAIASADPEDDAELICRPKKSPAKPAAKPAAKKCAGGVETAPSPRVDVSLAQVAREAGLEGEEPRQVEGQVAGQEEDGREEVSGEAQGTCIAIATPPTLPRAQAAPKKSPAKPKAAPKKSPKKAASPKAKPAAKAKSPKAKKSPRRVLHKRDGAHSFLTQARGEAGRQEARRQAGEGALQSIGHAQIEALRREVVDPRRAARLGDDGGRVRGEPLGGVG